MLCKWLIKLSGEEELPKAADPGFLARKDKSALSLFLAKTWAAFLPSLQRRKRRRPKQRQQHSSALDPWRSWCLHGSDGRRNIYTGHQADWLLGRKEEELLMKYFDRHCWIAVQIPLALFLAPIGQAVMAKWWHSQPPLQQEMAIWHHSDNSDMSGRHRRVLGKP